MSGHNPDRPDDYMRAGQYKYTEVFRLADADGNEHY
jgi:hypothetical protein